MDHVTPFHEIWNKVEIFEVQVSEAESDATWCGYAREFSKWVREWIIPMDEPQLFEINRAKILLFDKYLEWRSFVPRSHLDLIVTRSHTCIYHIFIQACEHIKVAELRQYNPVLLLPPNDPGSRPGPQFNGPLMYFGEVDE